MKESRAREKSVPLLRSLGARVRGMREQQGLTRRMLANQSGLSERFVSDLELGRGNISVLNLAHVAQVLGATAALLLSQEEAPSNPRGVVALLGLRGAGKSSVGQALARHLRAPFLELDRLVEVEAGMGLSELFAIHGEGYYRQVEVAALRKVLIAYPRAVMATGGGLVTSSEAFRLLRERARTVWLTASAEEHWQRVVKQGDLRPIRNQPHAMAELKRRLSEREPLYSQADVTCSTSGRSISQVVNELTRILTEDRRSFAGLASRSGQL